VPTIVFGPGDIDQAHTADEWIAVEEMATAASVYAQLALALPEALA
jgi:acetylornithine deacetylase